MLRIVLFESVASRRIIFQKQFPQKRFLKVKAGRFSKSTQSVEAAINAVIFT
jgi:hypothetical protein